MKIVALGIAAILAFDVLASVASRTFGFRYSYATVGSFLIYAIVGYSIGRVSPVSHATIGTLIVGLSEATIGWWLSWIIGPGQAASQTVTLNQILRAVFSVALIAGVIGGGAATFAHWQSEARTPAA